jgi:hypothetical protein
LQAQRMGHHFQPLQVGDLKFFLQFGHDFICLNLTI